MTVSTYILTLLGAFVQCFTAPGFDHFTCSMLARMSLLGLPHCVTETMRATGWHKLVHWTIPYVFMKRGRFSCQKLSRTLLELLLVRLAPAAVELIVAIDDTLIKKWGRQFFGLGRYPDPTDKNPGAGKRRVWGHCWVVAALLLEQAHGQWFCFPLAALLFVPEWACQAPWPFASKIELARLLLRRLALAGRKLTLVVDNLYAKAELIWIAEVTMVSRLRSNAALYDAPPPRKKGQRGRPRKRGQKVTARHLWAARKSKRRVLKAHIYGKLVTIEAFVDVLISSPTLGSRPLLVVIFPQRSGGKMNVFFSTDLALDPVRLLELYAARFKIEDAFDELKTVGGMGDYRQRGLTALKRHVTLSLLSYSLLRLAGLELPEAEAIEAEPWWAPKGTPSVTRMRRACAKAFGISASLHPKPQVLKIRAAKKTAKQNQHEDYAEAA